MMVSPEIYALFVGILTFFLSLIVLSIMVWFIGTIVSEGIIEGKEATRVIRIAILILFSISIAFAYGSFYETNYKYRAIDNLTKITNVKEAEEIANMTIGK